VPKLFADNRSKKTNSEICICWIRWGYD